MMIEKRRDIMIDDWVNRSKGRSFGATSQLLLRTVRLQMTSSSEEETRRPFLFKVFVFAFVFRVRQVSDQLVEINGDSTSGMTHSQAVEQIRRGGNRIHLVLKKGNGYVPDYGEATPTGHTVGHAHRTLFAVSRIGGCIRWQARPHSAPSSKILSNVAKETGSGMSPNASQPGFFCRRGGGDTY